MRVLVVSRCSRLGAVERVWLRESLQFMLTGVRESDAGSGCSVACVARHKHLAVSSRLHYACGHVHCRASDVVAAALDIPDVDPGVNFETEALDDGSERQRAADGVGSRRKGREHTIARVLDEATAKPLDLLRADAFVLVQQPAPATVAERVCMFGRFDEVCEEHRSQGALRFAARTRPGDEGLDLVAEELACLPQEDMVSSRNLDETGIRNVLGEVPSMLDRVERVV